MVREVRDLLAEALMSRLRCSIAAISLCFIGGVIQSEGSSVKEAKGYTNLRHRLIVELGKLRGLLLDLPPGGEFNLLGFARLLQTLELFLYTAHSVQPAEGRRA